MGKHWVPEAGPGRVTADMRVVGEESLKNLRSPGNCEFLNVSQKKKKKGRSLALACSCVFSPGFSACSIPSRLSASRCPLPSAAPVKTYLSLASFSALFRSFLSVILEVTAKS